MPTPAARIVWKTPASACCCIWTACGRGSSRAGCLASWISRPTRRSGRPAVRLLSRCDGRRRRRAGGVDLNAASVPASQLADRWGAPLAAPALGCGARWDRTSIRHVKEQQPGQRVQLQGFTGATNSLNVNVLAGIA